MCGGTHCRSNRCPGASQCGMPSQGAEKIIAVYALRQEAVLNESVKPDAWSTVSPGRGGTRDGPLTVHRPAGPPHRVPGLHECDSRRLPASARALRGGVLSAYGGVAARWTTPAPRPSPIRVSRWQSAGESGCASVALREKQKRMYRLTRHIAAAGRYRGSARGGFARAVTPLATARFGLALVFWWPEPDLAARPRRR